MRRLLALLVCLSAVAAGAQACEAGKVATLPIVFWHNAIYVQVSEDATSGLMLLDTGAPITMISSDFAHRAGARLQSGMRMELQAVGGEQSVVNMAGIRRLMIGAFPLDDKLFPMIDMDQRMEDGSLPAGILGSDILMLFDVELDIPARTMSLWRVFDCASIEPLHWTGDYASIPLNRESSRHVNIPIWLDGALLKATFDTGAGGLLMVNRRAAALAGASESALAADPPVHAHGIDTNAIEGVRHVFNTLLVGNDQLDQVKAFVVTDVQRTHGDDALLGMSFMRTHRMWLSYSTRTLFLQSAK